MSKEYGTIRWIDYYWEAPIKAEFIVREDESLNIRLEKYNGFKTSEVLHFFDHCALDKEFFEETLYKCRKIISCNKTIWVEKPMWKWLEDNPII